MSGFERGLLEAKERNELSQIAESLGKKPPTRAKKADIIDLILTLAGVTEAPATDVGDAPPSLPIDGDGDGDGDDAADPDPASGDAAGEDEVDDEDGRDDTVVAPAAPTGRNGQGRADARRGRGDQPGRDGGGGRDQGQGGRQDRPDQANRQDRPDQGNRQDRPDQANRQDRPDQANRQDRPDQANRQDRTDQANRQDRPDQGNRQDGGAQGDEEPEEGNRRRRRRGRNREGQPESFEGDPVEVEGLLDLREDGYGFLRLRGYLPSTEDVYVSVKQVRQFGLRKGDKVTGRSRPASRNEKNPALLQIDAVNGAAPDAARDRRRFEDLTPLFPDERLRLEMDGAAASMTTRIVDLLSPIGKGQRGLIVSPPKAGKTTIMKQIARAIERNSPDVALIVLLVDERPEEVTDMRRWLISGEVAASTFDRPSEEHIQVAELVIERAKRMVEDGRDVVIILDGITRLARAHNLATPPSGRIMSGGIDAAALYPPKRFFGAARNAEEGGSLTILATALVETGSKMDEHIFEEFKGTGNMELRLSRRLAERRIFPAIDVDASSTRHEELLFERRQVGQVETLRKVLGGVKDEAARRGEADPQVEALNLLLDRLKTFKTNAEFLDEVGKAKAGT